MLLQETLRQTSEQAKITFEKEKARNIKKEIEAELKFRAEHGKNSACFEIKREDLTTSGMKKQRKVSASVLSPSVLFMYDVNLYEEDLQNESKCIYDTLKSLEFEPDTERNDNKIYLVVRW